MREVGHYAAEVRHYAAEVGNYASSGGCECERWGIMLQMVDANGSISIMPHLSHSHPPLEA